MKVQDLLSVMDFTQKIQIKDKKDAEKSLYEGIVAGCYYEYKKCDVQKLHAMADCLLIEVDADPLHLNTSNDELLEMYFDESELGMDIGDLEKKLESLNREIQEFKFDFED